MPKDPDLALADLLLEVIVVVNAQSQLNVEVVTVLAGMADTRPERQEQIARLKEAMHRVIEDQDALTDKLKDYLSV